MPNSFGRLRSTFRSSEPSREKLVEVKLDVAFTSMI